ncbi:MAG: DUF2339 domain-containing protein [Candidatus Moraniibacteriota bacterium]
MSQEENGKDEISQNLENIRQAIVQLAQRLDEQDAKISKLEIGVSKEMPQSFVNMGIPVSPPPAPAYIPSSGNMDYQTPVSMWPEQKQKEDKRSNLEENIGGKWFARIGMVALVLGISFFLKYAFDNNWIGEIGRVMIGIISGIVLLGLGEKFIRKYQVYGQLISGGGLAVLYLSIFAAFSFYSLITQIPAFFMMALITFVGVILSIRYDAISLILVSTIGGFFTPFLISNGTNNEVGLFSYILILDLAVLAVSIFKKWRWLNIVGFLGTFIVFSSWAGEFYRDYEMFVTMVFLTLFFITYSISSLIYNLVQKEKSSGIEQFLTLMTGVTYFASSYAILNHDYHLFMGFFALGMAIYYFLWAYLVREFTPDDENLYGFLAFLTVGFITLAIPIQFDGKLITSGWAIEAVILLMLGLKTGQTAIKAFGVVVLEFAVVRMLFIDSTHGENDLVLFNKVILTYIIVIIASYLAAYIFRLFPQEENKDVFLAPKKLMAIFLIIANFLTIYSISREITYYYDQEMKTYRLQGERLYDEEQLTGKYVNDSFIYEKLNKLESKSSVSLSLFWLLYGIGLMFVGFLARIKGVRLGGMFLFCLAILKLFFFDLWSLGTLYRIVSSMSLGVVLLTISFVYQKYRDKIREII